MEVELKRLEDLSEDIVKDFSVMRKNEEEMRNTNGNYNFFQKSFLETFNCFLFLIVTQHYFP